MLNWIIGNKIRQVHVFQILSTFNLFVCLFVVFRNNGGSYILETFIKSGLHPITNHFAVWPKKSITVCLIRYSPGADNPDRIVTKWDIPESEDNDAVHAEKRLADYINNDEDLTKIQSITIYSNFSTCTECSDELNTLKDSVPGFSFKFASLYKFKRLSCAESKCNCGKGDLDAFAMLTGLGAMPFQREDWDDLINLLVRNDEQNLREFRYGDFYGAWRNGEDEKLMLDFEVMSQR